MNTTNRQNARQISETNTTPPVNTKQNEAVEILRDIQTLDFLITEAQLFLDTHPDDADALDYFDYYNQFYQELRTEYETQFGPLSVHGAIGGKTWSWVNEPWPWEALQ